jgi:hypothetical protein
MALTPPAKVYTRARMEEESGRGLGSGAPTRAASQLRLITLPSSMSPPSVIPEWDSRLNCSGASTAVRGGHTLQKAYRTYLQFNDDSTVANGRNHS